MTQSAKAQEPSMEEILASIRRIIADDDTAKTPPSGPAPAAAAPPRPLAAAPSPTAPPRAAPPPAPAAESAPMKQDDIDAMLADFDLPPEPEAAEPDILDLTESMAASSNSTPSFRRIEAESDVVFSEQTAPPEPPQAAPEPPVRGVDQPTRPSASAADRSLLSPSTSAMVDSAFNTLAHTVLVQNARTLDDLVREMLRPMLKTWLDDNLPGLVERMVRAEIERVSRGRG
jgi:cell pole-organizing protein PopZ